MKIRQFRRPKAQSKPFHFRTVVAFASVLMTLAACDEGKTSAEPANAVGSDAQTPATPTPMATKSVKPESSHLVLRLAYTQGGEVRLAEAKSVDRNLRNESGRAWEKRAWRLQALDENGQVIYENGFDDPTLVHVPPQAGRREHEDEAPAMIRRTQEVQWLAHVPSATATVKVFRLRPQQMGQRAISEHLYETLGTLTLTPSNVAQEAQ
jgi:hypothetical protein